MTSNNLHIKPATRKDVSLILQFIKQLAEYEKLSHEVVATEDSLKQTLFGKQKIAEVILGYFEDKPVGFALFFHNYSTFLGKPGVYLEDLFIKPEYRGKGFGKAFLVYLAHLTKVRNCGRLEWSVLDWNEPSINFYEKLGAKAMKEWIGFRLTGDALNTLAQE